MSDLFKDLTSLLEKRYGGLRTLDQERPLDQLVLLVLAKGTTAKKAESALQSLKESFADWNEVRVSEIAEIEEQLASLGQKGLTTKALNLRELLAAVYSCVNRMNLDFLRQSEDKSMSRKQEKFFGILEQVSPVSRVLFECYLTNGRPELTVSAGAMRVLGRLGVAKKAATAVQLSKRVESEIPENDWLVLHWGLNHLADEICLKATPECTQCFLRDRCPTAPEEIERRREIDARQKERERKELARSEAARLKAEKERRKAEEKAKRVAAAIAKEAEAARAAKKPARKPEAAPPKKSKVAKAKSAPEKPTRVAATSKKKSKAANTSRQR